MTNKKQVLKILEHRQIILDQNATFDPLDRLRVFRSVSWILMIRQSLELRSLQNVRGMLVSTNIKHPQIKQVQRS